LKPSKGGLFDGQSNASAGNDSEENRMDAAIFDTMYSF